MFSTVSRKIEIGVGVNEGSVNVAEKTSSLLLFFCALIDLNEYMYVPAIKYLKMSRARGVGFMEIDRGRMFTSFRECELKFLVQ